MGNSESENQSQPLKTPGAEPKNLKEGEGHGNNEVLELTELEAESVSGGLLPVNEGCINAYKC